MPVNLIDKIAAIVGIWALRRLFGGDCATDVREEFPDVQCLSCDASRLIKEMQELKQFLKT